MKIVIAPNAFKHALAADEVARAIYDGLVRSSVNAELITFPIGDGGDGTGKLLARVLGASWVLARVSDPLGRYIDSGYYLTDDHALAIIEMADASGIRLLQPSELNPLAASSYGTGELIRASLDAGVKKILLCVGGTTTVDGGAGILNALGAHLFDVAKQEIQLPKDLIHLHVLDLSKLDPRMSETQIIILADVKNVLLGEGGGVKMFSRQKGATPADIVMLERCVQKLADAVNEVSGKRIQDVISGGAAGGVAATLHGLFNATIVSGIDYFLNASRFDEVLKGADVLITGEGSLDEQTLEGKGPFGVAVKAKKEGIRVVGFAGVIASAKTLASVFDELVDINEGYSADGLLSVTRERLEQAAFTLGKRIATQAQGHEI